MAVNKPKKEVKAETPEVKVEAPAEVLTEAPTVEEVVQAPVEIPVETQPEVPPEALITLEEYLKEEAVNEYLLASFTYEGKFNEPSLLLPKSKDGWKRALQAQSNRVYE
jgi:hypothetical protein